MRTEIRIAGTGGMGVVLAGVILGHAAVVYGGLDAIQSQSYGSEAQPPRVKLLSVMNQSSTPKCGNQIIWLRCPRKHWTCIFRMQKREVYYL